MKIKANESSNLYISPEELIRYSRYPQKRTKAISAIIGGSVALLLGIFFAPSIANSVGLSCNHERSQVEQEEQRRKSGGIFGQLQGTLEDISGESKLDRLNSDLKTCESRQSWVLPLVFMSTVLTSSVFLYFGVNSFQKQIILRKRKTMASLWKKVNRFNEILKQIEVAEELDKIRNKTSSHDSKTELRTTLQEIRNNLIASLKTDGILFENPDYNPDKFLLDLGMLNEHYINEQATEYGEIFTEIMNANIEIKKQMAQD